MLHSIPISLYIHFPWCVQKCPYCDFNSHAIHQEIPQEIYLQRLLQDFDDSIEAFQSREIHSIFMGGGTPSLFSPHLIDSLLNHVQKKVRLKKNLEITLEANPGTVDEKNFKGFFITGINRLSIGVQSFNPVHLKTLGRIHDAHGAKRAIDSALRVGFSNFNIDLMHGLPNQTLKEAMCDLTTALSFSPPHLSWYQLTIEPNTLFYKIQPSLPPDDHLADIQAAGEDLLAQHGLQHYEVSAFAKPGKTSQHNTNYWQFGDYVGIGAGAHGKITLAAETPLIHRVHKIRQPKDYLAFGKSMIAGSEMIAQEKLPFEFLMNAMRLAQPILRETFETRTGLAWEILTPQLEKAVQKNLIEFDTKKISVTVLGRRFLNDLLTMFL